MFLEHTSSLEEHTSSLEVCNLRWFRYRRVHAKANMVDALLYVYSIVLVLSNPIHSFIINYYKPIDYVKLRNAGRKSWFANMVLLGFAFMNPSPVCDG
ncbi:hypothetical protein Y032_0293g1623 [Ancylostoma ceylanicum]|uniref:Uncharacterized protein n=1 Tax=Ancylostoma ceylanicum TaxID=53326 RepID=A0A016S5F6_9BILA|nr:hypothetical protein Y032_0293g1623 [Ancylostoma ceylanicum]